MLLVTNNWRMWAAGMAASLLIFAVLYFTVIAPDQNTANQALKTGLQQSQQAINQAQKQLGAAATQATTGSSASGQVSSVAGQAQQQLGSAAKLTACLSAAGTNAGAIQSCQANYAK